MTMGGILAVELRDFGDMERKTSMSQRIGDHRIVRLVVTSATDFSFSHQISRKPLVASMGLAIFTVRFQR